MLDNYKIFVESLNLILNNEVDDLNVSKPKEMYEPMGYIIGLGGKRVRPLLTLISCDLFDIPIQNASQSAIAVEFFHNFSLIHDDILDKAPLRRGKITVHEKWNNDIAILSGDGMMAKAFYVLCKSNQNHIGDLLRLFSKTAIEVCEGQQYDMNFESQNNVSVSEYIHMITNKTAVLLGCSLQMGAICANANTENQLHIYEFGKNIGIAFQLLDDVLDVYANDEKFGKQVGGDIISNKKTFLLLKAFELSSLEQKAQLNNLLKLSDDVTKVKLVTAIFNDLNIKQIATEEANKYTSLALTHLEKIKANDAKKESLKQFAFQLLNRNI
ncbi:MAG: polyprenyl synthetase family protein [Bacteroidota bacterium]